LRSTCGRKGKRPSAGAGEKHVENRFDDSKDKLNDRLGHQGIRFGYLETE
jgi:hypothetical protein